MNPILINHFKNLPVFLQKNCLKDLDDSTQKKCRKISKHWKDLIDLMKKRPQLPLELICIILSFLDDKSLQRIEYVSKLWRGITRSSFFAKELFCNQYLSGEIQRDFPLNWKSIVHSRSSFSLMSKPASCFKIGINIKRIRQYGNNSYFISYNNLLQTNRISKEKHNKGFSKEIFSTFSNCFDIFQNTFLVARRGKVTGVGISTGNLVGNVYINPYEFIRDIKVVENDLIILTEQHIYIYNLIDFRLQKIKLNFKYSDYDLQSFTRINNQDYLQIVDIKKRKFILNKQITSFSKEGYKFHFYIEKNFIFYYYSNENNKFSLSVSNLENNLEPRELNIEAQLSRIHIVSGEIFSVAHVCAVLCFVEGIISIINLETLEEVYKIDSEMMQSIRQVAIKAHYLFLNFADFNSEEYLLVTWDLTTNQQVKNFDCDRFQSGVLEMLWEKNVLVKIVTNKKISTTIFTTLNFSTLSPSVKIDHYKKKRCLIQ